MDSHANRAFTLAGVRIPIACSLAEAEARGQLEEWRLLLNLVSVEASRVSPTELEIHLTDGLDELPALVGLAQREKACCPFFDFGLEIGSDRVTLKVSVPGEAVSILDKFAWPQP